MKTKFYFNLQIIDTFLYYICILLYKIYMYVQKETQEALASPRCACFLSSPALVVLFKIRGSLQHIAYVLYTI